MRQRKNWLRKIVCVSSIKSGTIKTLVRPETATFLFLQKEFQEVLHHGGPHGADAVVAIQNRKGNCAAWDAIPVQEL